MTRIVKEYAVRRTEILDAAQRLVYTKGYEQMAIQDILDELQIAKGTFYHYFDSKQALLEAIVERIYEEIERLLVPIVQNPQLPFLEKFRRFFDAIGRWKIEQKSFLLALLRVWYTDDNVLVRQRARAIGTKCIKPLLTTIIHQGIQEGVLKISYPDQVSGVILWLIQGLQETLAELLLSPEREHDLPQLLYHLESTIAAYTDAFERVLGSPTGSLYLYDPETLREWVIYQETMDKSIP